MQTVKMQISLCHAQSDCAWHRLICTLICLFSKQNDRYIEALKIIASHSSSADWFEYYLVAKPVDRVYCGLVQFVL